jgi:hypothetical protein
MALAKLKIFEVYSHPRTNTGTGMPKWRSVSAPAQLLHPALLIGDVEACQSFTPHVIAEIGESSLGQGFAGLARPRAAHPEGERMIKRHDPAPTALPVGSSRPGQSEPPGDCTNGSPDRSQCRLEFASRFGHSG